MSKTLDHILRGVDRGLFDVGIQPPDSQMPHAGFRCYRRNEPLVIRMHTAVGGSFHLRSVRRIFRNRMYKRDEDYENYLGFRCIWRGDG